MVIFGLSGWSHLLQPGRKQTWLWRTSSTWFSPREHGTLPLGVVTGNKFLLQHEGPPKWQVLVYNYNNYNKWDSWISGIYLYLHGENKTTTSPRQPKALPVPIGSVGLFDIGNPISPMQVYICLSYRVNYVWYVYTPFVILSHTYIYSMYLYIYM